MAYERGLLQGSNTNELQEAVLMSVLVQEKRAEFEKSETDFENQIMLHRPDVWQKILEEREEANEMGFDEIVWKSPETMEEFLELDEMFSNLPNPTHIENIEEKKFPTAFNNLDINKLGDEE